MRIAPPSDWLHPVVVRDVKTALRGRVYLVTMAIACLAVLGIAMWSVQREHQGHSMSRWTLVVTLQCLLPILLFVLPIQAFVSLRDEVVSGTADGLVLTNLRPLSIVFGVLQASVLQGAMFVGVFAPLLALSYLTLAADVWTLLQVLWLLLLCNIVATALAFAMLALLRVKHLRDHTQLVAMAVLGVATIAAVTEIDQVLAWLEEFARSELFGLTAIRQFAVAVLATVMLCMVGASALTQFQENKIIARRILGIAAAPVVTVLAGVGMQAVPLACLFSLWIWYDGVVELPQFTRRQRVLCPLDRREAMRMRILLPGSARGFEYSIRIAGLILVTALVAEFVTGNRSSLIDYGVAVHCVGYIVLFAGIFCYLRHTAFEASRMGSESARFRLLPGTLLILFPLMLFDVMLRSLFGVQLLPVGGPNPFSGTPRSLSVSFVALVIALVVTGRLVWPYVAASRRELLALVDKHNGSVET